MGVFNGYTNFLVPQSEIGQGRKVPSYVPTFVNIGAVFLVAGGAYMCLRNMVWTIKSIPPSSNSKSRALLLQIERSPSIPFIRPKTIQVPPGDITLSSPIWMGEEEQIEREVAELRHKEHRADAFDMQKGGIRSLLFKQLVYWLERFQGGLKKALTNHGLLQLHVRGYNLPWKLEQRSAWALDEGQVLDKLVKIRIV
ncbi:MAG: hypothetical protein Q9217_003148 [Psora testacea]